MKLLLLGHTKKVISYLILLLSALQMASCSQNDNQDSAPQALANITVLGKNDNAIFQANINAGTDVSTFNLTNTSGINPNSTLMTLNNYDNTFGFYIFPQIGQDDYTVWDKNIEANQAIEYSDFCVETTIETPYFPEVSEHYITIFTAELISPGNRILNLRIYDKTLNSCTKTSIGVADQFQLLTRLIVENYILTYHFNDQNQAVISKIRLETGALEEQITLDSEGAATVRGNVLYFYPRSGDFDQISYNLNTFQLLEMATFSTNTFLSNGLFKSESRDNAILIDGNYAQPSQFTRFPALLDQNNGMLTQLVDLNNIDNNLLPFLDTDLLIEVSDDYTVDLENNTIIGSYTLFNFELTIIAYGIYYSDFSGSILGVAPIDFRADKIIIH